jgi:molybdopterin synthase catalytic subunit
VITEAPLDLSDLVAAVDAPGHGAQASFVGMVRDNHDGKRVEGVTYDCFAPLAEKTLHDIVAAAEKRHGAKIAAAHRVGRLAVGEASVAIAAGAPHREQAFAACREVIEEIKRRLPVWKQEHYAEGGSSWLDGCRLSGAP